MPAPIDLPRHPVFFGHPLHAILSDLPAALIPVALVSETARMLRPSSRTRFLSDAASIAALTAGLAAAAAGWLDWLTMPTEHPAQKDKETLRRHWGDWPALKQQLSRGHARSLVDYLVSHPTDFRGAVARLRPELRGLYLAAYQSDLWNRTLAHWLRQHVAAEDLRPIALRLGEFPVPVQLSDEFERSRTFTG